VYRPPSPSVIDVVHEELARWPGGAPAELRGPSSYLGTHAEREVDGAAQLTALTGVVAVVGHQDSRSTLLAAPVYDEARIPLVVPTATSRAIGTASPWIFPLAPNDSQEGAFIAAFATRALGAQAVALLYDNDEYGRGLRDGLRAALAAAGRRLTAEAPIGTVCESGGASDASLALIAPRRNPPDVVVIASRPRDAGCIVHQIGTRHPGIRFIAGDAVEIRDSVLAAMGPAAVSTYFVAFWHPGLTDAPSATFTAAYQRIVGTAPTPGAAMQYDAIMLLMQAQREVGPRPKAIQAYLTQLAQSRPAYQGVTGPIAFGAGRERPLYMLRIRGGVGVAVPVP
ncbi:MAG TPA: ABC transporter substrate-binding protein, partial [Gemmatimonadales bacterium]|nr:ABC transporter substrate-binding protein [Gemmatimonadales bacterium]